MLSYVILVGNRLAKVFSFMFLIQKKHESLVHSLVMKNQHKHTLTNTHSGSHDIRNEG